MLQDINIIIEIEGTSYIDDTNDYVISSLENNARTLIFTIDSAYDLYTKKVVIKNSKQKVFTIDLVNDECQLTDTVLSNGKLFLQLYMINGDVIIRDNTILEFDVALSIDNNSAISSDSTLSAQIQSHIADTDIHYSDAPSDDTVYGRINGEWQVVGGAGGSTAWGTITGTLSNQLDLQGELDSKADLVHTHTESNITDLDKYSQSEVDALLLDKSDITHTHAELHTHNNKALLDTYDQTNADITNAVTNSHTHTNKALLDSLTSNGDGNSFLANDGTYKAVSSGSASWGGITGTLSDQTDLQTALDLKVDESITVNGQALSANVTIDADDIDDSATTNKFTNQVDIDKLSGIEAGAQVNTVDSVNSKTGIVVLDKSDIGLSNVDNTSDLDKPISTATQEVFDNIFSTYEPTGFYNQTDSTLSFDNGTRTFTISPTTISYDIIQQGVKSTISTDKTVVISNFEGIHHIYFDGTTLNEVTTLTEDIIKNKVYTAIVYWDVTNQVMLYIGDERHGHRMDGDTHYYLHEVHGSAYVSGGGLGDFVVGGNGSLDSHAQFSIGSGLFFDEDIQFSLDNVMSTNGLDVYYRIGTTAWRKGINAGFSVLTTGTGRLAYNQNIGGSWQLTEVTNNQFALYHIFMSNDNNRKYISIMGQNTYSILSNARQGALSELNSLVTTGLPFQEFVGIATVIYQTNNIDTNAVKSAIVSTDDGSDYIDWRFNNITPTSTTASSHNDLTNRDSINSHPATAISYDNTTSGLTAINVKTAIDELDSNLDGKANTIHTHVEADITDLQSYLLDAPIDGSTYGRLNGAWSVVSGSGAVDSVNGQTGIVILDSDDIAEGSVNLYATGNEFDTTTNTMDDITDGTTYVKTENNFTDTLLTKLNGIEAGADVNVVTSVNTQTGAVVLDSDDISEGVTNLYLTGNEFQKNIDTMDNITNGATYVKTTNDYTTTEKNKLSGIETGAEVNNISDTDAGILTGDASADSLHKHSEITEQRDSAQMKVWYGTTAQYTALGTKDANTIYFCS